MIDIVNLGSDTISNTISTTMSSTFGSIPPHHAVTIRLTKNNFIIWCVQLLPCLWSTKFMGYLDGTIVAPAKLVPSSIAAHDQDQHVLSCLLSSMFEEILHDVVVATTSKEAWDTLQWMFSSSTRARAVQIRVELAIR